MKKNFFALISSSRKFLYYLGIGLGLTLFLWQLWQGAQAVYQLAFQLNPFYLIAAFGLLLVAYALQMIAWAEIMRGLGSSISLLVVMQGYMVSFLPRYIPGTIWGYLSRDEWLKSQYGMPYARSTWGSAIEVGLILSTASVISGSYYLWQIWLEPIRLTIVIGVLLIPWLIWYSFKWVWYLLASKRLVLVANPIKLPVNFWCWLNAYFIYLVMWSCHGLSLMSLLKAFSTGYDGNVFETTFMFSLSWLAGFVVLIVPSGLGIREFVLANLLVSQSTLNLQIASAVAVVSRLAIYLAEFAWLLLGLLMMRLRVKIAPG